jgi:hypothetical protein
VDDENVSVDVSAGRTGGADIEAPKMKVRFYNGRRD